MNQSARVATTLLFLPMALGAQNKATAPEPTVWGALTRTSSCVIFAEGHRTSGKFYGIAVTTKAIGKLTLIETQNYTFSEIEVLETQEKMDSLTQLAQKDHVKFVKIPEKYSPELLERRGPLANQVQNRP